MLAIRQIDIIETRIVHSLEGACGHYRELLAKGKEGAIIKHPVGFGVTVPSKEQIKLKPEVDVDLEMTALIPGEGKNTSTFGSVACRSRCGQLAVNVSGFSDAKRAEIFAAWPETQGRIMAVRGNAIARPSDSNLLHSLFLPRYVEIRATSDKTLADDLTDVLG